MACRVLNVSRSGYYDWKDRPLSDRDAENELLTKHILTIHANSRETYGWPRVHAELTLGLGWQVNHKRVARLMRQAGVQGLYRRRNRSGPARAATEDDLALHVVSTVVSRAAPERGILDAGSKTLTADPGGGLDGYGLILEYPEARIKQFAEEHGFLDLSASQARPQVGEVVRIVPNHVCVVVNMVDRLIATRGGDIVGEIPVAARGRIS